VQTYCLVDLEEELVGRSLPVIIFIHFAPTAFEHFDRKMLCPTPSPGQLSWT
jgi:hypothetical protein